MSTSYYTSDQSMILCIDFWCWLSFGCLVFQKDCLVSRVRGKSWIEPWEIRHWVIVFTFAQSPWILSILHQVLGLKDKEQFIDLRWFKQFKHIPGHFNRNGKRNLKFSARLCSPAVVSQFALSPSNFTWDLCELSGVRSDWSWRRWLGQLSYHLFRKFFSNANSWGKL